MSNQLKTLKSLTVYAKTLYIKCLMGLWISLWLDLPGNVLCDNKKSVRIFQIEYFRKIALTISLLKARRGRDSSPSSMLIRYNIHTIYHSNKRGPPPFFHSDTNPVLCHILAYFAGKTHVMVVRVELIWLLVLNILPFNFVLRFLAVVLTIIKVTLLFCLMGAVQSGHFPFFAPPLPIVNSYP